MNKLISFSGVILLFLTLGFLNINTKKEGRDKILVLTPDGNSTNQTIHNFGASDAWSCQFVGKYWHINKKEQIADWLFSREFDNNNNPKGIGLSIWRFNIGGGSTFQGKSSDIKDEWRRAESFMIHKGEYDWTQHKGQRWFLQAAKKRGVKEFVGFLNSPPVSLTKNGKAYSSDSEHYNLPKENYHLYAEYLSAIVKNMLEKEGILFKYISPFNEPQWDWTNAGQEGTPAQNKEIYEITKVINQSFENNTIESLIEIPESAQINYLYEEGNKKGRARHIYGFFNASSPLYLGNLSHIAHKIAGHSYYTTWPKDKLIDTRTTLANAIANNSQNIEFWMSEYCLLEDNKLIKGHGRDLGMDAALYNARVIFSDLAIGNASSWQWWLAISPYNFKDGLIYIDHDKFNGEIYHSKLLWTLGNYSRFIEPGMKRINVLRSDSRTDEQTLDHLMASAYLSEDKSKTSLVLVNYLKTKMDIQIKLKDMNPDCTLKMYLTDAVSENNLRFTQIVKPKDIITIPPQSVVTITNVE